jgi:hypothetical protein
VSPVTERFVDAYARAGAAVRAGAITPTAIARLDRDLDGAVLQERPLLDVVLVHDTPSGSESTKR